MEQGFLISIHAPAWGATIKDDEIVSNNTDFNPRARVGRDYAGRIRSCRLSNVNPRARVGRAPSCVR